MRTLARLLAVRPGEGRRVALLAALLAAVEAARGTAEVATDTLFLSRFGVEYLPVLYLALGGVSLVAGVAYLAGVGRFRSMAFPAVLLGAIGAALLLERVAMLSGASGLFPIAWLTVNVGNALLLTLIWTIAGSVLDTRQARRLFPILTSATIAGGFVGTLAAGPIARLAGAENLLVVAAGLLGLAAILGRQVGQRFGRPGRPARLRAAVPSVARELRTGFDFVRGSTLLRLIAAAYVLFAVLMFSVSFPFLQAVSGATSSEADLATTLGLISAAITGASFVVALVLARPVYARFGVATGALALPVVYLGGFGLWLIAFTVPTAIAVRIGQQVVQRGLSNAAWSAFATTVPAERRAQVLAFLDGVPGQLGTSLSGLLLLAATGLLGRDQIFGLGFLAAIACTVVVWQVRRHYGESLVATLRSGLVEQILEGGRGIDALDNDPQVVAALRTALRGHSGSVRRLAIDLLARLGRTEAIPDIVEASQDLEPAVRAAALSALATLAGPGPSHVTAGGHGDAGPTGGGGPPDVAGSTLDAAIAAAAARLADDAPEVRAAAVAALDRLDRARVLAVSTVLANDASPAVRAGLAVALVRAGEEDRPHAILVDLLESPTATDRVAGLDAVARLRGHVPTTAMFDGLADPSPLVRQAAIRAAVAVDPGVGDPLSALARALDDDDVGVRGTAADALREFGDGSIAVALDTLRTGSERAQAAAIRALAGASEVVGGVLVEWSLGQIDRAQTLRASRRALQAAPDVWETPEGQFLCSLLEGRQRTVEELVLGTLSVLGVPEATGPLRRGLRADDPETRAQAIEAIDVLGERRIARALVVLIEPDDAHATADPDAVLESLGRDPDPWIRALALRRLERRLSNSHRAILDRMRDDPDPLVRAAITTHRPEGGPMPETSDTLDLVDRVLFLRRVPIFAQLSPEDLQRIASAAQERWYPAGEAIFREGELGDELVVIVEGTVRIVRDDAGRERHIRDFGPGDHIGELAVLREMPRMATVLSGEPGVRGLVIAGEGLKAILRERPDAAMAMLASLADRLSAM